MADEAVNPKSLAKRGFWSVWEESAKWGAKEIVGALVLTLGGGGVVVGALKTIWPVAVGILLFAGGTFFILGSAVLAIRRGPAPAASQLPAAAYSLPMPKEVTAYVNYGVGTEKLRGIGLIGEPTIHYNDRRSPAVFDCCCVVTFIGFFDDATASPHELLLTCPVTGTLLARLETDDAVRRSGATTYRGTSDVVTMGRQIAQSGPKPTIQQLIVPIREGTFCDVAIRLPSGTALAAHKESGVKLDSELVPGVPAKKKFRIVVRNLSPHEPDSRYDQVINLI